MSWLSQLDAQWLFRTCRRLFPSDGELGNNPIRRMTPSGKWHGGQRSLSLPADSVRQDDDPGNAQSRRLRLHHSLNGRFRWRLNWSWSCCELFEVLYPPRFRLGRSISPHNRSRTNAEHGAKQRAPRRPQEENEDKHKHQKCFPKSRLRVAFVIDIEQHCEN